MEASEVGTITTSDGIKRSLRIATRVERKKDDGTTSKEYLRPRTKWPLRDRFTLLKAIRKHGTRDIEAIKKHLTFYSEDDINNFVAKEKRLQAFDKVEIPPPPQFEFIDPQLGSLAPGTKTIKKLMKRENNSAIEKWIALTEKVSKDHRELTSSETLLPNVLDYISENELHPKPEDCNGVDYAAIYRALADLMHGDVPAQLNAESSRKLLEVFHEFQQDHKPIDRELIGQPEMVAMYGLREAALSRAPTKTRHIFFDDCAVNPLHLPKELLSKNILKKKSS